LVVNWGPPIQPLDTIVLWRKRRFRKVVWCWKPWFSDLWVYERLASLGIMEVQLRALLKLPVHHTIVFKGLRRILNWSPIVPRDASLFESRCTLRELAFHFLSHWMGSNFGDRFPFDFEPNGNPFGLNSLSILNQMEIHLVQNRKENCHHDQIPFNVKGSGNIVFSV